MQHDTSNMRGELRVTLRTREQAAYEALRGAIIAGRWQPGEALVVSRLAQDLGMSRIPVTNAMKQLASEGFVRMRPHQEAIVAPLDAADIREIYLMRAALEALAAEEAAHKASTTDLDELTQLNETIRHTADTSGATLAEVRAADKAFHTRLRNLAGMPHLAQTLTNLADQCEYYRVCLLDQHLFSPPSPDRHLPIIKAIEQHDAPQAHALMRTHILEGMHLMLKALEDSP